MSNQTPATLLPLTAQSELAAELSRDMLIARRAPALLKIFERHVEDSITQSHWNLPFLDKFANERLGENATRALGFLLADSDLWEPLTAAYGPCDGMLRGKYKHTRLFVFETPSLYLWCLSETGNRGTDWLLAKKTEAAMLVTQGRALSSFDASSDSLLVSEIIDFVEQLATGMALSHAPTMKRLQAFMPSLTALEEALILRQNLSHQSLPASLSKLRL